MTRFEHIVYWSSIATRSYVLGFVAAALAFLAGRTSTLRERGAPSAFTLCRLTWIMFLVPTAACTWIAGEGDPDSIIRDHTFGSVALVSWSVAVVTSAIEVIQIRRDVHFNPILIGARVAGLFSTAVVTFLLALTPMAYVVGTVIGHGNWPPSTTLPNTFPSRGGRVLRRACRTAMPDGSMS